MYREINTVCICLVSQSAAGAGESSWQRQRRKKLPVKQPYASSEILVYNETVELCLLYRIIKVIGESILYTAGKFTFLSYIRRVSEQNISSSRYKDKQNISWDGNVLQDVKKKQTEKINNVGENSKNNVIGNLFNAKM